MGYGTFAPTDWDHFTATKTVGRTREEIFERDDIKADFDPRKIKVRESRDSADNPVTTPIIVALDVTGSMGAIPETLIRDGLGRMATEILERKPVPGPQLMFMAVGDAAAGDRAPLQVTQFESDIRVAEQLKELFLEGGGGGNRDESYHLPWYFAARKTETDAFSKHGRKGLLFTIGDEGVSPVLRAQDIQRVMGDGPQADVKTEDLLRMVEERYDVFHLVIKQGSNYQSDPHYVDETWKKLLGQRVIPVSDYTKVPEVIVSTLELMAGVAKPEIEKSWDGSTAMVVREALSALAPVPARGATPAVWRPAANTDRATTAPVHGRKPKRAVK